MFNKIKKYFEQREIERKRTKFETFTKDFKDISISIIPIIVIENFLTLLGISEGFIFTIYMFLGILFALLPTFLAFGIIQKYKENLIRKGLIAYSAIISGLGIYIGYEISIINIIGQI